MPSLRERKKRKTKKAIIDAAVRLFGTKGFEKTSIEELAKEAGIGKGTIYSYFQTKSDILYAFCEDQLEYVYDELERKTDANAPLIDQLLTIFLTEFTEITRNKEFGRFYMQQTLFPSDHDRDRFEHVDDRWMELLYSIFDRAKQRGDLREDIDLLFIAGHFYALFILAISSWYAGRVTTSQIEPGMRKLFEQVLEGIGT